MVDTAEAPPYQHHLSWEQVRHELEKQETYSAGLPHSRATTGVNSYKQQDVSMIQPTSVRKHRTSGYQRASILHQHGIVDATAGGGIGDGCRAPSPIYMPQQHTSVSHDREIKRWKVLPPSMAPKPSKPPPGWAMKQAKTHPQDVQRVTRRLPHPPLGVAQPTMRLPNPAVGSVRHGTLRSPASPTTVAAVRSLRQQHEQGTGWQHGGMNERHRVQRVVDGNPPSPSVVIDAVGGGQTVWRA